MKDIKYNAFSIFTFSTDRTITNLIDKYSERILLKVTNDVSYNYYIIVTALNYLELKEILNISSEGIIMINSVNDINTIAMGKYQTFLNEDTFKDILDNYKNIDELQLTETISANTDDKKEDIFKFTDFQDITNLSEFDVVDYTNNLANKNGDSELTNDDIMSEIDGILDKGADMGKKTKERYDYLVNLLKER